MKLLEGRKLAIIFELEQGWIPSAAPGGLLARSLAMGWKPYHHEIVRVVNALDIIIIGTRRRAHVLTIISVTYK